MAILYLFLFTSTIFAVNVMSGEVAFHAQMTHSPTLQSGRIVLFDQVDLNDGGGFNNGVFTAPVEGIYTFSVTVTAAANCFVTWYIENDGKIYAKVLADSVSGASDSATGNAVMSLQEGDRVFVKHFANRCGVRCDVHTCPVFSGFLIN